MKQTFFLFTMLLLMLGASADDYKLYLWVKYPKYVNYAYGLEIAVNNKRMGAIRVKELAEIHLKGDKKYFIEIFDQGRSIGSTQIQSLKDSISYYQLTLDVKGFSVTMDLLPQDKLTGGLYVMQTSNYTQKLVFFEDGLDEDSNGPSFGSAFLISSSGYIITNYHVIEGAKSIKVKGIEGDFTTEYAADVVTKDISNDLAVLQLKNKNVKFSDPPFTMRLQGANTGEDIFVLGYPLGPALGEEIKLTTGVISSKSGFEGNASSYQISAPVQPGNSGGPVFDSKGALTGIVNAKIMKADNISYAIKSIYLQALLSMLPTEPVYPATNTLQDKNLAEKVSLISKFVYIVETN